MPKKVLIVGGVAAGASAATKARREDEDAEIYLFEKGPYISFANCGLPYYISGEIKDRNKLIVTTPKTLEKRFNVRVLTNHEVKSVNTHIKTIEVEDLKKGELKTFSYDSLVLAPGAQPVVPPFLGKDADNFFLLRTIPDTDKLHNFIITKHPKKALVVGGGFIGLECLEAFVSRGIEVTLVEKLDQILPNLDTDMASYVEAEIERMGVKMILGKGVKSFEKDEAGLIKKAYLEDGSMVECDLVLLSIGVRPDVQLAKKAGIQIDDSGTIKVNNRMETSVEGIFAAGDAVESVNIVTGKPGWFALAGPANQQGRIAGANAVGKNLHFKGTLGTFIVRIGKAIAAKTGLSEREAQKEGYEYVTIFIHPKHHASYYPGAKSLHIKALAEKGSGRLIGAQIVGEEGVDKRIDVFATAIFFKGSLEDLGDLNLAYAPPFGSARDAANQVGLVGSHMVHGDLKPYSSLRAQNDGELNHIFIDVREPHELEKGKIPNAINIPLSKLRQSLPDLKKMVNSRDVVPYCEVGYRSYLAYRILKQKGLEKAKNFSGGFWTYLATMKKNKT